ncbi:unnamed protein product [Dracunculus medinensis]|uniref:Uncharacterized protein n=1 Tax=Dracunculus medinensis TaxID=318479 RepID=A0A0N4UK12_DRAME|nr:unnamed protein product [Dracunculus medinensis]
MGSSGLVPRSSFATWSICHLFTSRRNCRIYRYYVSVLSLKSDDCKSNNAASNLFRAFAFFIKKINDDSKSFKNELTRLEDFLASYKTRFLVSDNLTHQFEISKSFRHIRLYLGRGYSTESFKRSYPSGQEIILYWADRSEFEFTNSITIMPTKTDL